MRVPVHLPATCPAPTVAWLGGAEAALVALQAAGLVGTDGRCLPVGWLRGEVPVRFGDVPAHLRLTRHGGVHTTVAFKRADLILDDRAGALHFYDPLPETLKEGLQHRYVHDVFDHALLHGSEITIKGMHQCNSATTLRLDVPVVELALP